MNIVKLVSFGSAGLALHGTANAHMVSHFHTHSDLSIGFALIAAGPVAGWLLYKYFKG